MHGSSCSVSLGLSYALLVALQAPVALAAAHDVTRSIAIDDFESPRGWFTWAGDSKPLPTGGIRIVEAGAHGGKRCASLYYDVSCNSGYVATGTNLLLPAGTKEIRFQARTDAQVVFIVRIHDSKGQTHQKHVSLTSGPWQEVVLSLSEPWPHRYGGPADGTLYQPIVRIEFLRAAGSEPAAGTVYLDDVQAVATASSDEWRGYYWKRAEGGLRVDVPGNLFYPSDAVKADVFVTPAPFPETGELNATLSFFDAFEKPVASVPVAMKGDGAGLGASVALPEAPGFYYVKLAVSDGQRSREFETRYAVIPPNGDPDRRDPESPFGVNTHFNQGWPAEVGAIVKRAGIAWIRDGEANPGDSAFPVAQANKLCYLPCFTHWTAKAAGQLRAYLEAGKTEPSDWDFGEAAAWHGSFAEKYGHAVDYYDLMNEPHEQWGAVMGGSWWGGAWLRGFAEYGRQVTAAIGEADPGATVLWEDVDQLLWYSQWVKLGVSDYVGGISPHTYNLHRNAPLPEQQPVLGQFPAFFAFRREHKLNWPVWAGEVGFSSFVMGAKSGPFYTPQTESQQASMLVRMMATQFTAGMDKIFWYDFRNDGWERDYHEHNFGLIRADNTPKPAVVAYANFVSQFRHGRWLGQYNIGGGARCLAFLRSMDNRFVLVAWALEGSKSEPIPVDSGSKEVRVTDIYGQIATIAAKGGTVVLPLSTSPVYVTGLGEEDVRPFVTPATR